MYSLQKTYRICTGHASLATAVQGNITRWDCPKQTNVRTVQLQILKKGTLGYYINTVKLSDYQGGSIFLISNTMLCFRYL